MHLGTGSFGTVTLDPDGTTCTKVFTDPAYKPHYVSIQEELDDMGREYFGGKILQYTEDTNDPDMITKIRMVYQGDSLYNMIHPKTRKTIVDRRVLARSFLNLLEGLCILSKRGHVHNDIKLDNITYNPDTGLLKFIDFDTFEHKHEHLSKHPVGSYIQAPELWLIQRSPSTNTIQQIKSLAKIFKNAHFFNDKDSGVLKGLISGGGRTDVRTNNWWLSELLEFVKKGSRDFSKTDVYSLGLVALEVFYPGFPQLRGVINGMLRPDPAQRLTADDAYKKWSAINYAQQNQLPLDRAAMTISMILLL